MAGFCQIFMEQMGNLSRIALWGYRSKGDMNMAFVAQLTDRIWIPWLLGLFIVTGLYYSVRTGFFQIFGIRRWLGATIGSLRRDKKRSAGGITSIQALATGLASTIGTGSIAGVATAICFGGPGAVLWLWVSAVLGMMTGCAEKILAVTWRRRQADGSWEGGPMYYLTYGLNAPFLATWFAVACVGGALAGGNLVQTNSIAQTLHAAFGWNKLAVGIVTAIAAGVVLMGGIGRISRFSELLVPIMGALFLGGGAVVLWMRRAYLPGALSQIISCAFTPSAAVGGVGGYTVLSAVRYGVARGVFTNEAGMGSTAIAHANSDARSPGEQGMWGILETFVATPVICTMSALVILTAGVYQPAEGSGALIGAPLTAASFGAVLGQTGEVLVSVCLLLFAFSSLLGWSYYGETALSWLLRGKTGWRNLWRAIVLCVAVVGSVCDAGQVWQVVDLFTALMALPNLVALLAMSPQVLKQLKEYLQ